MMAQSNEHMLLAELRLLPEREAESETEQSNAYKLLEELFLRECISLGMDC